MPFLVAYCFWLSALGSTYKDLKHSNSKALRREDVMLGSTYKDLKHTVSRLLVSVISS